MVRIVLEVLFYIQWICSVTDLKIKEIFVNLNCINRMPVYSEQKDGSTMVLFKTGFTVLYRI